MSNLRARSSRTTRSLKIVADLTVLAEGDENEEDKMEMDVDIQDENTPVIQQNSQEQEMRKSTQSQRAATLSKAQQNKEFAAAKRSAKISLEKLPLKQESPASTAKEENISDLLLKALDNEKGQKTTIKKLYADRIEVLTDCKVDLMRRCLWEAHFMAIPEGQKLVGFMISKIGFDSTEKLINKIVLYKKPTPKSQLHGIGEALMVAWKDANKNEKYDDCKAIEGLWYHIVRESILAEGSVGQKFADITTPLKSLDRKAFDPFLYRILSPIVATYMNSVNSCVRFEVSKYVFDFYPLIPEDNDERQQTIVELLKDECVEIRAHAVIKALEIINDFWAVTSMDFVQAVMEQLVDELANDSHPSVRSCVFKSIRQLCDCAGGVNILEHALRCVVEKGLNDKNEKVRQSCVNLLYAIKSHRFIRYFDIVEVDALLARFEVETSQAALEPFVKLLFSSYHPKNSSPETKIKRLNHLIKKGGRNAALNFHRLIFSLKLINVTDAVNLIKFMIANVYSKWKKGIPATLDMTSCSLNETIQNSEFGGEPLRNSDELEPMTIDRERDIIIFECLIVLWRSISKELEKPEFEKESQLLERLGMKFFQKMYNEFRNDPSIGATMALGCLLKNGRMEAASQQCLNELFAGNVAEEAVIPYLSFISAWRLKDLFRLITNDFACLSSINGSPSSPPKKRGKKSSQLSPEAAVQRAINYLRYELSVRSVNFEMVKENVFELKTVYEVLAPIGEVLLYFLSGPALEHPPICGKLINQVFNMKLVINGLLMCSARMNCKDVLSVDHYLLDLQQNIEWACLNLPSTLGMLYENDDDRWPFGFEACKSLLDAMPEKINICEELAREEKENPNESRKNVDQMETDENSELNISGVPLWQMVISAYIDLISSLSDKKVPIHQLLPLLESAKVLLVASQKFRALAYCTLSGDMVSCALRVVSAVPDWLHNLNDQIERPDANELPRVCLAVYRAVFEGQYCSNEQKDKAMSAIIRTLIMERISDCEQMHNVADPRELDFEISPLASLLIHKVIFRSKQMQKSFALNAISLFGSKGQRNFLPEEQENLDALVYRIGASAQLVYLSDISILKKKTNKSESTIRRSAEEVKNMISLLQRRMMELMERNDREIKLPSGKTVTCSFEDDAIRTQVKELIEYEEDTAF